jgi:RNA polymerase sigma-70 factor (ECF subfamily)
MALEASEQFDQLIERVRRGDQQAMATLCQQYEPRLRIVARVLLGSALHPYLDSMDLVQTVHRTLLFGLRQDKFDVSSPERLIALALTMVRRKVARQWRHLQRQQRLSSAAFHSGDHPMSLADLSAPKADPAHAVQFDDQVQRLCRHLDATERRILEMRLQGFGTAEIAEQLGLNHVTLRVRMTRLRERLRSAGALREWF